MTVVNLDFDARVPIPFSVFPSSYRNDAAPSEGKTETTTHTRVEGEVRLPQVNARVGREEVHGREESYSEEDIFIEEKDRYRRRKQDTFVPEIEVHRETRIRKEREYDDSGFEIIDPVYAQPERTQPIYEDELPRQSTHISYTRESDERSYREPKKHHHKHTMGYYDDEGHHHSFRHGLKRAAENVFRPRYRETVREEISIDEEPRRSRGGEHSHSHSHGGSRSTYTVPCQHIRVGDLVILQHRPCQIIRISTSTTGQHRYLGVDLFTRQLYEEPCVVSHPAASVILHSMIAPVYKQYRVIDIGETGRVVAMTETGDIKTGLRVVDQGGLFDRLADAFENGRGSARVLVVQDGSEELVIDFKVAQGGRL